MDIEVNSWTQNIPFLIFLSAGAIVLIGIAINLIFGSSKKEEEPADPESGIAWPQFSDDWLKKVAKDEEGCNLNVGPPSPTVPDPIPVGQKRDANGRFIAVGGVSKDKIRSKANFAEFKAYKEARGPITFKEWLVVRKTQWYKDLKAEDANERKSL